LLYVLFVFKVEGNYFLSALFIALTFENYERCFFLYEILILIKTKNINVCCFQVVTNQTNMIIYFNDTNNNIFYRKSCL